MEQEIQVSIVCITYNQEQYIKETIDSFLKQKTDFKYEIIIHDDASTDSTPKIIQEYCKQYPEIIKAIFEKKNQYSRGVAIIEECILPYVHGKYIAFCEGDDFWTDCYKLKKQVSALEKHAECNICGHSVKVVQEDGKEQRGIIRPKKQDCVIETSEVIEGGGDFIGTNSLVIRTEVLENALPFRKMYTLDYTLQVMGALRGGMVYLDECMSAYRYCATGSWTVEMNSQLLKRCIHSLKVLEMLKQLDIDTEYKYKNSVHKIYIKQLKNTIEVLNIFNTDMCKYMSVKEKIDINLKNLYHKVMSPLLKVRRKTKSE